MTTYGRIAFYSFKPGSLDPLLEKAREELPAQVKQQPGFVRYAVLRSGANDIASLSVWEIREQSEAASKQLVGWVHDNFSSDLVSAENLYGETIVAEWSVTEMPHWGRIGVNRVRGSMQDGLRGATEYIIPALKQQPGFCTHTTWQTGDSQMVVFTTFDSADHGTAADRAIAPIFKQHVEEGITLEKVVTGDLLWTVRSR